MLYNKDKRGRLRPIKGWKMPKDIYSPEWLDWIWRRVKKTDTCWVWTGRTTTRYGTIQVEGHRHHVHRVIYEVLIGPIPNGLVLDHLCRHRLCVRPAHLQPVTDQVNILRGDGITAQEARRQYCPHGHAYDLLNTRFDKKGARHCRMCERKRIVQRARDGYWSKRKGQPEAVLAAFREAT